MADECEVVIATVNEDMKCNISILTLSYRNSNDDCEQKICMEFKQTKCGSKHISAAMQKQRKIFDL